MTPLPDMTGVPPSVQTTGRQVGRETATEIAQLMPHGRFRGLIHRELPELKQAGGADGS